MKSHSAPIAWRTSFLYWLVAAIWILVSDKILGLMVEDVHRFEELQSYKGWAFVTVTAVMLYWALRAQLKQQAVQERQRQEVENRYRALVESSADGIYIHQDGRITYANPALVRLLGAQSDRQIVGRQPFDIIHPEFHELVRERMRSLNVVGDKVPVAEERFIRLDGSTVDVEVTAAVMAYREGLSIQVSARDITERKRAQRALAVSEERLRLAMDSANMGAWDRDLKSGVLKWTPILERMHGFEPGTFPGTFEAFTALVHPEDLPIVEAARDKALRGAGDYVAELRFKKPGGGIRWALVRGKVMRDAVGEPERILGVEMDITERKLAEQRVRESEARLQLALEASRMGVWERDLVSGRIFWSAECRSLFGVESFNGTHEEVAKLIHPDDYDSLMNAVDNAIASRGTYMAEYRIVRPDGQVRWIAAQARVICDQNGAPIRMIGTVREVTSRKMAELAINERLELERRLTLLASCAPGAIYSFRLRPDGTSFFPYASSKFRDMFGLKPESLANDSGPAFALVHADDLPRVQATIAESGRELTPWRETFRINHPQRGVIWLDGNSDPLREEDGSTLWHGFLIDVTTRHLAEERLRQSEERLRLLMSGIQEHAIYLLTTDGCVASWNSGAERVKGYDEDEILGKHLSTFYPPDDVAAGKPQRALEIAADVGRFDDEGWRLRKDGSRFWASVSLTAIYDENRFLRGFTKITHDLSARKAAEAEVNQQRLRLEAIVNSAMDGIITVDADQNVLVFNPAAEKMFRCRAPDALGKPLDRFIPERSRSGHRRHLDEFGATGVSTRAMGSFGAISGLRTNGEEFPIEASISQVVVDGQKLFTVTCRDITERVRAEELRRSLEVQLVQAQKMEAMGTLAGGIAHDFNNILTAILGNVELARWDLDSKASVAASLDEIALAGNRAKNVVRQILTFSRQQPQNRELISLAPVVEECIGLLRATIPASVELEKNLLPGLPSVLADSNQIHQVILNLCTNAWHSLPDRRGRIRVALDEARFDVDAAEKIAGIETGNYVRLIVEDNGSGMDDATMERIFEPFFTTKPPGEGSGLGLSVVHGIVKSHDGTIDVSSQPDKGTKITILFPAVDKLPASQAPRRESPKPGHGECILYIDDEEQLVALATRMLKRLGYEVEAYQRPDRGLEAFLMAPEKYAVVITDFNMPGISGMEVAGEIRRVQSGIPIVLSSGYISDDLVQQARQQGIEHIIHKPNTIAELSAVLSSILNGKS